MTGVCVLASYPKSGNTWVRAFLAALATGTDRFDLADLPGHGHLARANLDDVLGIDGADLHPAEAARYRGEACRLLLAGRPAPIVLKMHDCWRPFPGSDAFPLPADMIETVILLVRDPRDVVLSKAHRDGGDVDTEIRRLGDPAYPLAAVPQGISWQCAQFMSSWSSHAASWLESGLPVHLFRYEDLLADPLPHFQALAGAAGFADDAGAVARAVAATRFDVLRDSEAAGQFGEGARNPGAAFFRQGQAGGWRGRLGAAQIDRIERDHGAMMRRLGYLP